MKLGQITPDHLAKLIRELEEQGLSASYIEELLKPFADDYVSLARLPFAR
jgi:hypothetical protein